MADFKYEITKEIGVLSKNAKGWRKELNLISWNGGAANSRSKCIVQAVHSSGRLVIMLAR